MKRRVSGVVFARIWAEVKEWGQQDRAGLLDLIRESMDEKGADPKKRAPRKPKGGPAEVAG